MRNDPRQASLFDALELPAALIPMQPPEPPAPAPATVREKLSLDIGDTFLGYVDGDVCFWQRAVEGIGDGMMPTYCYVLVRFHADPEGKVYRKHVRSADIERDLEWAIEVALFWEAQSFFYLRTGNATPRHLSKRDMLAKPPGVRAQSLKQEPPAPVKANAGVSPEDVAYVEAAILDILPKGWPSYATEVLRVRRVPSKGEGCLIKNRSGTAAVATIRLFDGEIGQLRLEGVPGAHGYSWKVGRRDKRPFHFDEAAWAWVRVDEDAA